MNLCRSKTNKQLVLDLGEEKIMRARIALVIEEELLAKVDEIAGDKLKRSATIVKAITEFIKGKL